MPQLVHLTACVLLACSTTALAQITRPAAKDTRIYVHIASESRDGFVDIDKGIADSMKDVRNALNRNRRVRLTEKPGEADIIVRIIQRGLVVSDDQGTVVMPLGTGLAALPVRASAYVLSAVMEVGEYRRELAGKALTWNGTARNIAGDVDAWIASNRAAVMDARSR